MEAAEIGKLLDIIGDKPEDFVDTLEELSEATSNKKLKKALSVAAEELSCLCEEDDDEDEEDDESDDDDGDDVSFE